MRTYQGPEEDWQPRIFPTEVVIGFFLLFVAAAFTLLWWTARQGREFNALEQNGIKGKGLVRAVRPISSGNSDTYSIDYSFTYNGAVYERSETSKLSFRPGDPVTVTFLRSDPQQFSTIGTPRGAPRQVLHLLLIGLAAALPGIGFLVWAGIKSARKPKISVPDWYQ